MDLDWAAKINAFLASKIAGLPDIENDVFSRAEGDAIVSRHDPAAYAEKQFIDGSKQCSASLAYYARSADAKNCRDWLKEISAALDGQCVDGFDASAETALQFVSLDDKNQAIYTATVAVEWHEKGE